MAETHEVTLLLGEWAKGNQKALDELTPLVYRERTQGHVYIRSFLTHKKYDNPGNWDRRFGTK